MLFSILIPLIRSPAVLYLFVDHWDERDRNHAHIEREEGPRVNGKTKIESTIIDESGILLDEC